MDLLHLAHAQPVFLHSPGAVQTCHRPIGWRQFPNCEILLSKYVKLLTKISPGTLNETLIAEIMSETVCMKCDAPSLATWTPREG